MLPARGSTCCPTSASRRIELSVRRRDTSLDAPDFGRSCLERRTGSRPQRLKWPDDGSCCRISRETPVESAQPPLLGGEN